MKRTLFKKILSSFCALTILGAGLGVIPAALPTAAAGLDFTPTVDSPVPAHDAVISGSNTGFYAASEKDVIAMQFVLTANAASVSTDVPSFSNNTGSVTLALFAFDTDYDTSLLSSPLAEHTFVDFKDGADLGFAFDKSPLPAGEYLLVLYDMKDPTPNANGGSQTGIGVWTGAPHEGQRAYMNGSYVADTTYPVRVDYVTTPAKLYGIPTKPAAAEGIDYAPHMAAVLDFSDKATMSYVGGGHQTKASQVTEDGVTFLRLAADKDAGDPYQFINFPDTLIKCTEYKYALIKLRRTDGSNTQSQLFFTTDEQGLAEPASVRPNYKNTTDWQYVIVNLGANNNYHGLLKSFRMDYFQSCKGSHHVDVQYIALFKSQDAAEAFHDNFDDFKTSTPEGGDKEDPTVSPDYSTYISADTPADTVDGKLTENGRLGYLYKDYPYVMDFTDKSPEDYAAEGGFAFTAIDCAIVKDSRLCCKAFSTYSVYTKKFLGDAYGIRGGSLDFDMVLEAGEITVILRQVKPNDDVKYSGIRFTLAADGTLTVTERDGLSDTVKLDTDLTREHKFSFVDNGSSLPVLVDGKAVYTLMWDIVTKTLTTPAGKSFSAIHVPDAGYAALQVTRTRGYLDTISYTYTDIVSKSVTAHSVDYSTWVATDDLDRTTPTYAEVGVGKDKYVGIFYFMIHSDDMGSRYVNDVTRFYLEGGTDHLASKLASFAGRNGCYWAEPYFGYYSSHDTWVYRKHAYMLDAAGVDFIFLDVSNNRFYVEQCKVLFDTWKSIRDEGGQTPQIAFMYGDMPFTLLNGLYTLLEPFYDNPDYQELLFCWEDKPLVLGNKDTLDDRRWTVSDTTPQTKEYYKEQLNNNPDLKTFYENTYKTLISERFTVRKCWAWQAGNKGREGYWDWLQESPQALGTDFDGNPEQISVSMGVHAHTSRGRSYLNGDNTYNPNGNFGFTLGTAKYGYFFAEQFEYALTQNVDVIMITGWNEWYAGVHTASSADQTCGQTPTPNYYMVDQMSPEYSRDGEPMRIRDGEGFGDNYYYQMVSYIRRFKGPDAPPATVNGGSLSTADKAEWEKVSPAFTDVVGDTDLRSAGSFCYEFLYTNGTARNDLDTAKVSQDADHLYFHITTATPLITVDDELWMNLYVDADNNPSTGWEGFDYIINRSRTDKTVSVERFVDGKWEFETVGEGEYTLSESAMTIKVAKTALGHKAGDTVSLSFKWADNADVRGDVMRFMELGDTAPNDRFVFAYTASTTEDERNKSEDTSEDTTPEDTAPDDTVAEDTTSPNTAAPDTTASETTAETDDGAHSEPHEKKGCRSTLSVSAGILVTAIMGAVALRKRKE